MSTARNTSHLSPNPLLSFLLAKEWPALIQDLAKSLGISYEVPEKATQENYHNLWKKYVLVPYQKEQPINAALVPHSFMFTVVDDPRRKLAHSIPVISDGISLTMHQAMLQATFNDFQSRATTYSIIENGTGIAWSFDFRDQFVKADWLKSCHLITCLGLYPTLNISMPLRDGSGFISECTTLTLSAFNGDYPAALRSAGVKISGAETKMDGPGTVQTPDAKGSLESSYEFLSQAHQHGKFPELTQDLTYKGKAILHVVASQARTDLKTRTDCDKAAIQEHVVNAICEAKSIEDVDNIYKRFLIGNLLERRENPNFDRLFRKDKFTGTKIACVQAAQQKIYELLISSADLKGDAEKNKGFIDNMFSPDLAEKNGVPAKWAQQYAELEPIFNKMQKDNVKGSVKDFMKIQPAEFKIAAKPCAAKCFKR